MRTSAAPHVSRNFKKARHAAAQTAIRNSRYRSVICMAKTGPKPRPGRNPLPVACKPHERVAAALQAGADKHGVARGIYMEHVLAHALDLDQFAPELPEIVDPQEELPLKTA